jgi:hypothetical protein
VLPNAEFSEGLIFSRGSPFGFLGERVSAKVSPSSARWQHNESELTRRIAAEAAAGFFFGGLGERASERSGCAQFGQVAAESFRTDSQNSPRRAADSACGVGPCLAAGYLELLQDPEGEVLRPMLTALRTTLGQGCPNLPGNYFC